MFTVGQTCYLQIGEGSSSELKVGRIIEASDYAAVVRFEENLFPQLESDVILFAESRGLMMEHPMRVSGHRQNRAAATVEFTRTATSWPTAAPVPAEQLAGAA